MLLTVPMRKAMFARCRGRTTVTGTKRTAAGPPTFLALDVETNNTLLSINTTIGTTSQHFPRQQSATSNFQCPRRSSDSLCYLSFVVISALSLQDRGQVLRSRCRGPTTRSAQNGSKKYRNLRTPRNLFFSASGRRSVGPSGHICAIFGYPSEAPGV